MNQIPVAASESTFSVLRAVAPKTTEDSKKARVLIHVKKPDAVETKSGNPGGKFFGLILFGKTSGDMNDVVWCIVRK